MKSAKQNNLTEVNKIKKLSELKYLKQNKTHYSLNKIKIF